MPPEASKLLVQVLRKIPIFKGLSPSQVKQILSVCQHKSYKPGAQICRSNAPADEMFVLLSGQLVVATSEGVRVATILPVTTVGEMGVITGQPRSATVEVAKPSNILTIQRNQFDFMLREDREMRGTVYHNIIDVLATKLTNDNIRLRDYQIEKDRFEGRISVLQRQVKEHERRAQVAIEMAAKETGRHLDEVTLHVDDQVKELTPTLMVVDDEPDIRRLVRDALPSFAVVEAADGVEALGMVQEHKLDLVLTDIRMPNMDGFGLLASLRDQFPDLPVVAVSGFVDEEQVAEHGFDGFVDKPVDLKDLQDLVAASVRRDGADE